MGRKKIAITRIQDERNRQITFSKRKAGLLKKAYELSILCDCEIAVIMMTNNRKLYQYASSNMNSILIRYTEFKDPDESKTNADILDDIHKKERSSHLGDESGEEDDPASAQSFMLTPHTQAQYRKLDEGFDQMLHHSPVPGSLHTAGPPQVMPVTVPVTQSPGVLNQQIQQHLQQQLEIRVSALSAVNSASSSASMSSLISPQSDMSSSPASARSLKSPVAMPPPVGTPTRLQTLRNQTLKLHLPGSGRNYISLGGPGSAGGSISPGIKSAGVEGENEEGEPAGKGGGGGGNKPHLRVMIPGQKGFVPRTRAISPLPQMELTSTTAAGGGGGGGRGGAGGGGEGGGGGAAANSTTSTGAPSTSFQQTSTHSDSLTTPILSMATPNLLSSLPPPLFSSLTGDFPFGALMSSGLGSGTAGGGGGGGGEISSALVAFPVSIQPSSSGPSTNAGNIVLQAQNMGQPFLLTPNIDPRQNSFLTQQTYQPPPSSSLSPNIRDLEQLKQHYDRVQQQLLQQQLFISQQLQQSQDTGKVAAPSLATSSSSTPLKKDSPGREQVSPKEPTVLKDKPKTTVVVVSAPSDVDQGMDTAEQPSPGKRSRVDECSEQPTSV